MKIINMTYDEFDSSALVFARAHSHVTLKFYRGLILSRLYVSRFYYQRTRLGGLVGCQEDISIYEPSSKTRNDDLSRRGFSGSCQENPCDFPRL